MVTHLANDPRPIFMRLRSSDSRVLTEVLLWNEYAELLAHVRGEVRGILDLGANVGMSVRYWQRRFPGARIVVVEPHPGNHALSVRNANTEPLPPGGPVEVLRAGPGRFDSHVLDRGEIAILVLVERS